MYISNNLFNTVWYQALCDAWYIGYNDQDRMVHFLKLSGKTNKVMGTMGNNRNIVKTHMTQTEEH